MEWRRKPAQSHWVWYAFTGSIIVLASVRVDYRSYLLRLLRASVREPEPGGILGSPASLRISLRCRKIPNRLRQGSRAWISGSVHGSLTALASIARAAPENALQTLLRRRLGLHRSIESWILSTLTSARPRSRRYEHPRHCPCARTNSTCRRRQSPRSGSRNRVSNWPGAACNSAKYPHDLHPLFRLGIRHLISDPKRQLRRARRYAPARWSSNVLRPAPTEGEIASHAPKFVRACLSSTTDQGPSRGRRSRKSASRTEPDSPKPGLMPSPCCRQAQSSRAGCAGDIVAGVRLKQVAGGKVVSSFPRSLRRTPRHGNFDPGRHE